MDASEKVDWNIILYFGIALECDSPIINSLVQSRPTLVASLMCKSLQKHARRQLSELPPVVKDMFYVVQRSHGKYKGEFEVKSRRDSSSASFNICGYRVVVKIEALTDSGVYLTRISEMGTKNRVCNDVHLFDVGSWFVATCQQLVWFFSEAHNIQRAIRERLLASTQEVTICMHDIYI
jgi:hypothetical protein